jgi:glycosyltransferase involved in cell wall biosynthesis
MSTNGSSSKDGVVSRPLVSIITPTYNRACFLDETIRSVLAQDYRPIEFIVIDDGSVDDTRDVLAKYSGDVAWWTHENIGETRTVNEGLRACAGDIIAVVNSDDPLRPGAISEGVAFLRDRPHVLVAYPDWDYIGTDSEVLAHVRVPEFDYVHMVRSHHCLVGPGALMRRRVVALEKGRDPVYRYVGDFEFWLRVGLHGPFARIPRTLATFRVHTDSASQASLGRRMASEHLEMMRRYYSRADLPREILAVRRAAFASAHFVAAGSSGDSRWTALRHYGCTMLLDPKNWSPDRTASLRRMLAESSGWGVAPIWHFARRVVRLGRRLRQVFFRARR